MIIRIHFILLNELRLIHYLNFSFIKENMEINQKYCICSVLKSTSVCHKIELEQFNPCSFCLGVAKENTFL